MLVHSGKKLMKVTAIASLMLCAFVFLFFPEISSAQGGIMSSIGSGIERILWTFVNVFFGWLVYVGGIVLNIGVNTYVVGFGAQYESTGLGFAIDSLWVVIRDIFNLTFIFGLVLIGLKMIFNADDAGNKRMLVMLIMAALLVNFSLFITKFVVDFANIAAYQLVEAFPKVEGKADISSSFMELMGLRGLLNFGTSAGFNFSDMTNGAGLGYIFGTLLLYLIAAFVFLGGGLLLMIRFVVLNLYMVLSPLMFLGWVFPAASSVTGEYWKGFLGRAFFAPAYILMLYLSYHILSSFSGTAGGKTLSSIFVPTGRDTFESVVPPFILTSIFLIASIVIAQKMGANGGNAVMSAGKAMAGKARKYTQQKVGNATIGATAAVGRRTVGRVANTLSNSQKFKDYAAKDKWFVGRAGLGALKAVGDSSFDARKIGGVGKSLDIGEGRKGGYATMIKEKKEADKKFAEDLGEVDTRDEDGLFLDGMEDQRNAKATELSNSQEYIALKEKMTKEKHERAVADAQAVIDRKAAIDTEISRLTNDESEARRNGEPAATVAAKKALLDDFKTQSTNEMDSLKTKAKKSKEAAEKADEAFNKKLLAEAESSIRYQNQLNLIATIEAQASWRSRFANAVGLGSGGAAATTGFALSGLAAGSGAGVVAGLLSHTALASGADIRTASVKNLRKTYGRNGQKLAKKDKQKNDLKVLREALDEDAPKGDTTKDGSADKDA